MRIYLDHNATTPVRPEVVEAMAAALRERWGNPSSTHAEGAAARAVLERAREQVAELLGAEPREVLFTSGATEANNTVLRGVLATSRGRHVVSTTVEHPSVAEPLRTLEAEGVAVSYVPVDPEGRLDPAAVAAALREDTALLSVILANNESGVLQPVAEIARRARGRGLRVLCDAVQAAGKIPVDFEILGADYLVVSGHKFGGPKGAGALIVRPGAPFEPLFRGSGHERGRRG